MQAEYLKRRFEVKDKDDLHRLISGIELSRSLKTHEKEVKDGVNQLEVKGLGKQTFTIENQKQEEICRRQLHYAQYAQ